MTQSLTMTFDQARRLVKDLQALYERTPDNTKRFGAWVLETLYPEEFELLASRGAAEDLYYAQRTVDAGYYMMALFQRGDLPAQRAIDACKQGAIA